VVDVFAAFRAFFVPLLLAPGESAAPRVPGNATSKPDLLAPAGVLGIGSAALLASALITM